MAWLHQRRQRTPRAESEINITPMLDVVFILLIFFIVTTAFVKERGLPLSGSSRGRVESDGPPPLLLHISALGQFQLWQQSIEASALRPRLAALHVQRPTSVLIINAHPDSPVEAVVLALDAGRLAGIENLQLARQRIALAAN